MTGAELAGVFDRLTEKYERTPRHALARMMVIARVTRAIEFHPSEQWLDRIVEEERILDREVAKWSELARSRALAKRFEAAIERLKSGKPPVQRRRGRRAASR